MTEHNDNQHALTHQPLEGEIIRDAHELQELLDKPSMKIAEVVTGMLAAGRSDYILAGGRIVQAAMKKNAYVQIGREIKALREKGKIKEDYTETKYGFKPLSELLEFVDSDAPDEDRLHAAKAMFYAVKFHCNGRRRADSRV